MFAVVKEFDVPKATARGAVLVIDDDHLVVDILVDLLESEGYSVKTGSTAAGAIEAVREGHHGAIFLDLNLPDEQGLSIFERLQALNPENRIIVITGQDSINILMSAMHAGAFDFIVKGDDLGERVVVSTRNAFEAMDKEQTIASLSGAVSGGAREIRVISAAPAMKPVLSGIQKLAKSRVSVLIQGASGTGKEVVALAIHNGGSRRDKPFVAFNCAGIPDNLLESELLGYERGAFTGAVARKIGKFEQANRGTIFLDEIGEMSLPLQAKILRVVQDGRFERLGGTTQVEVDVRVLSATNRNLSQMVAESSFREDLYYRLAVFTLDLPVLSSRQEDIEPLARHFLLEACQAEMRDDIPKISPEVLRLFKGHPWPGNVRQLHNVMSHAVVVCNGELLTISHMPASFRDGLVDEEGSTSAEGGTNGDISPTDLPISSEIERARIRFAAWTESVDERLDVALGQAFPGTEMLPSINQLKMAGIRLLLERLAGNRKRTAERLGISRTTLYRMVESDGV